MILTIIIVSSAKNKQLEEMTQQAINTASFKNNISKEIIVVESENVQYDNVNIKLSSNNLSLNYNRFLNMGIEKSSGDFIALCNNDLFFYENWDEEIISVMLKNNILSASPYNSKPRLINDNDKIVFGYQIFEVLCGWCIVANREVIKKIKKLNESVEFWYSDNLYSAQIQKHNIKHALIKTSFVKHLLSQTFRTLNKELQQKYTDDQKQIFDNIKI